MSKGTYIVIEGLDGCGKTTQFKRLVDYLGKSTVAIHEPGSTPMAEKIRALVKDRSIPRDHAANSFLFAAARADLIGSILRPAINAGKIVVSDRNWLTSAAYQTAEGADLQSIITLNQLAAAEFFEPDLCILIDAEPELCRKRLLARGDHDSDYFDTKGIEFFDRARQIYLQEIKNFTHTCIVDGNQTPEEVWQEIKTLYTRFISAKKRHLIR